MTALDAIGSRAPSVAAIRAFAPPTPAQERDPSVAEEITVFEAQVTVDTSGLGVIDRQRLRPDQILLLEGGVPRRVTNLEALGTRRLAHPRLHRRSHLARPHRQAGGAAARQPGAHSSPTSAASRS